ncbi:MAG: DUF2130 domain-containing protein [Phycisphaerae bacterium]|nr:DUF2130 domain-containing protein [Phycisphaerae bacterium]
MSSTITCPNCDNEIEITEVMSAQLRDEIRRELEKDVNVKRQQLTAREREIEKRQLEIDEAEKSIDAKVGKQLAAERDKLEASARAKAKEELGVELKDRDAQITELRDKVKTAEETELALRKRERELKDREGELAQQRDRMEEEARQKLDAARQGLIDRAKAEAKNELSVEMKDRDEREAELRGKLDEANKQELEWRKRERALNAEKEELELSVQRRLTEERDKIRDEALKKADEDHRLKDAEKDKKITDLVKQLDEAKRRAEQGSQQSQGEIQELALEEMLASRFPADDFAEIGKGVAGADVMQRVRTSAGVDAGSILWESKRTKSWKKEWLPKLRKDQREAKADVTVIVSAHLPDGVETFSQIDGVWVCSWPCAVSLAMALRSGLLETAKARRALAGQQGKMEQVYNYLASPEFRNRVAGIAEAFATMQQDLDKEKRAIQNHWAKREKQIEQAVANTAGMYGDLQGIIGGSLPEIQGMDMLMLEANA